MNIALAMISATVRGLRRRGGTAETPNDDGEIDEADICGFMCIHAATWKAPIAHGRFARGAGLVAQMCNCCYAGQAVSTIERADALSELVHVTIVRRGSSASGAGLGIDGSGTADRKSGVGGSLPTNGQDASGAFFI